VAFADHVLAVASHFEAPGSYMKRQGRVQRFESAVEPPGLAVAGWAALSEVLAALGGIRYGEHDVLLEAILIELGGGSPTSDTRLGLAGLQLAG
jgi:anaerobic selenocysteine-containing dehydrogenase